jgi:hypothetical protein
MPNTKQYIAFGPGVWEERMTTEQPAVDEAIFRRRASLPANFLLELEDMRCQRAIIETGECPEGRA